jgi:DNA ligase-1
MNKLYKKDSTGKVREWSVKTCGDLVTVTHGVVGGKLQETYTTCKPKNIGKANETTGPEQALLEAKALHVKQVERNCYVTDLSHPPAYVQPMLARDYRKVPEQVKWQDKEYVGQAKLNGVRCMFVDGKLQSRKGVEYKAPDHLVEELEELSKLLPDRSYLDGEIYKPGMLLNRINSAAKKRNDDTDSLEFHLFDVATEGLGFHYRSRDMFKHLREQPKTFIKPVETHTLSVDNVKPLHDAMVLLGYEGLMIREANGLYGFGERSSALFKYKEFIEEEFAILGMRQDKYGGGTLICRTEAGVEFRARHIGTDAFRAMLWDDRDSYVGKTVTVRFFSYTEYGAPEFPVAHIIL